jgi:hypothetical protein
MTLGDQPQAPGNVSLVGQRIISVIPTRIIDAGTHQQVILVAAYDGDGILRSSDGGRTFQTVRGPSGPLTGFATDLVADPNDSNIFYAAIRATYDVNGDLATSGGIFCSKDGGVRWAEIDSGIPHTTPAGVITRSNSLKLAIFDNASGVVSMASRTILYAGEANTSPGDNSLIGIFRTTNPGDAQPQWSPLFFDSIPTNVPWPAAVWVPWFAMAVDPNNWNNIYFGGMSWLYRAQVTPRSPPSSGFATNWTDWSSGAGWDFRSMSFLTNNILLATGDPGIYGLFDPENSRQWV